ncbi:MAG: carboxypeptidase regulatory-like domain-containing protein [bacterium]|nr:carboxypeptidase regulatory-like domain-containing protein [bacterium]
MVSGRVYRGEEEHPATVAFRVYEIGDNVEIETDGSGFYKTLLFQPGVFLVHVKLKGIGGPPYIEWLDEPIRESRTLDFHIPTLIGKVKVVDSNTGDGVSDAEVVIGNKFSSERRDGSGDGRSKSVAESTTTNAAGIAETQPLRPGLVTVRVRADGYLPPETIEVEVHHGEENREITITLNPIDSSRPVKIILPDGRPAAGAEVRAQQTLGNTFAMWEASADSKGLIEVPEKVDGAFLLIRHPEAGSLARRWRFVDASAEADLWSLPPAGETLVVQVTRSWGRDPAPWAELALFVEDLRISGVTLAWYSWARSAADSHGSWKGNGLPARPIRLLAWMRGQEDAAVQGLLDSLAVQIPYPWDRVVELQAIE